MLDTVIVLGHAWTKPLNKKNPQVSIAGCMNILAAVQLYLQGKTKHLIITGGQTAGKNHKSESEKMFDYVYTFFTKKEVPPEIFFLEKKALDTGENARNIRQILKQNNFRKIGLITTSWHMKRAAKIFEASHIDIEQQFICDDIIQTVDTSKVAPFIQQLQEFTRLKTSDIYILINAFLNSSAVKKYRIKEFISIYISVFDPEEKFLHLLTRYRTVFYY